LGAIAGRRPDIEPVCLGQGGRLTGFNARREAGQGHDRRSQKREYRQGGERFDHWELLTLSGRPSRRDWGSVDNNPYGHKFHNHNLYLNQSPWAPP
jgi:hypothetical protein